MKKASASEFALRWCVFTLGVGLMLPEVPWLRPLGLLVVFAAGYLPGQELMPPKFPRFFVLLGLIMAQVVMGIMDSDRAEQRHFRPHARWVIIMIVIWAWSLFEDYKKWHSSTSTEVHDP